MTEFSIHFAAPLVAVSIDSSLSFQLEESNIEVEPSQKEPVQTEQLAAPEPEAELSVAPNSSAEIIAEIEKAVATICQKIEQQEQQLLAQASTLAIEVARVILDSSPEIIEARLTANLNRILFDEPLSIGTKVFSHSDCLPAMRTYFSAESSYSINDLEFAADDELPPGDCRIEFGESGRRANLKNQLEVIKHKLAGISLIADQGSSAC